jgi:hypothetical protein
VNGNRETKRGCPTRVQMPKHGLHFRHLKGQRRVLAGIVLLVTILLEQQLACGGVSNLGGRRFNARSTW